MLHSKFHGNRPAGSGEEDFYRVFTIFGHGGHLGHGTSIILSDFHFIVSESFEKKIGVHDLGPRSRNDRDLQYSHTFIYSIRGLFLLTFR